MKSKVSIFAVLTFTCAVIVTANLIRDFITPTMSAYTWTETTRFVREGETLWGISSEYCPANINRSEWIENVTQINDIQSYKIYAGDRITVLIPE
jgi:hypothetical protein